MRSIDLRNAVSNSEDNFTAILFRLMLKADQVNLARLAISYPIEARMVRLYKEGQFPPDARGNPDFEAIERDAVFDSRFTSEAAHAAWESLTAGMDSGELPLCAGYVLGLSGRNDPVLKKDEQARLKRAGEILYYLTYVLGSGR